MTIPKNSRRAKEVLAQARNIRVYSLSNCFHAQPITEKPCVWGGPLLNDRYTELIPVSQGEFLAHELNGMKSTRLSHDGNDSYSIHVHDNLWYEFESETSIG